MNSVVTDDLEHFYMDRISKIDEERLKITKYINIIKPNQRELHTLEWDNKLLSEANMKIDYELCDINDDLRRVGIQNQEARSELLIIARRHTANQSQIQQLAELSQPVQRDITYFFDNKYSLVAPVHSDGRKGSNPTLQRSKIVRAAEEQTPRPQIIQSVPKQVATRQTFLGDYLNAFYLFHLCNHDTSLTTSHEMHPM